MTMKRLAIPLLLLGGLATGALMAQTPDLDGPTHPFSDSLVEQLAGDWVMAGTMGRQQVGYQVHAEWVLGHQFLRFAMRDTAQVPAYEAQVYIGHDNTSDRYVAHWLDVFGGRWSETLGFGTRSGNTIEFLFEYPDGPFRTAFTRAPNGDWTVLMRQRAGAGPWQTFGQYVLRRR